MSRVLLASVPGAIRVVVLCSRSADRITVGSHAARTHRPDRRIFAGLACGKGATRPTSGTGEGKNRRTAAPTNTKEEIAGRMPTIQQLVRKGREDKVNKAKT